MTPTYRVDVSGTAGFWVRSALAVVALAAGLDMLRAAVTRAAGPLLSGPAPDWSGALEASVTHPSGVPTLALATVMLLIGLTFASNAWRERRWRRVYGPLLARLAAGELEPLKHRPASKMLLADERVRDLSYDLRELCQKGAPPSDLEHALDVYQHLLDSCDAEPTGSHGLLIVQTGLEIRSVLNGTPAREAGGAS